MSATPIPALVLGGSGYVAGELLRLLSGHPQFALAAVVSESRAGQPVEASFPQLAASPLDGLRFADPASLPEILRRTPSLAVFSALPHGEAAPRIDALLAAAESAGCVARVVDLSADFRHRDPAIYEAIYGRPHAAPARLAQFTCALPEHVHGEPLGHLAHPGCFATAATLALAPLVASGWIEPRATVVATTGSTGAGRAPSPTTHHPERRSDLFAYSPFVHRHEPEIRALLGALAPPDGPEPAIAFAPQSGPFARGIHATAVVRLTRPASAETLRAAASSYYAGAPFVRVGAAPPRLQAVVGTNRCDLAFAARGEDALVFAAIDNLVKGAAGGALQWMNRLFGLPETAGLALAGLGWL
ncbi:MAG: N-acetyl-gamma-glutamyl-phosphate reductase [Thermoanaerobaculia bacterium]